MFLLTKQRTLSIMILSVLFKEVYSMSICPKNKSSKGRRDSRRANWKMAAATLVKCPKCGSLMMPHRVCKNCGTYNKQEIVKVED